MDKLTWKQLWEEYLSEAKRFNGKQLTEIFGDPNVVIIPPPLEKPDLLNGLDKKLIGEFIRRNHPRLAHEIALGGFPGEKDLIFACDLSHNDRNLIGLIARSHGVDLRFCSDYIERLFGKNNRRVPLNVHATYLMVLLRIADYIQIDQSRTSKTLLKLKTFASPISEIEHGAHLAIEAIDDSFQDDPERIYVTTAPNDSRMYFKLKRLLSAIQGEFDRSWAVLGELYGERPNRPEIRFRRIDSNLEEKHFVDSLNFVPEQLAFKANDELIKLLIAPLYGDDPTFGVRELLQNAIDACRERELKETNGIAYDPQIHVTINQEASGYFFNITDNGTGMDTEIIKNYFLKAGASFRNSMSWQRDFTNDNGKPQIMRSGRFGIGVLAAFLLGDEIEVQTRKFDRPNGFIFNATIDTTQIELRKHKSLPIGTTIRVRIPKEIYHRLDPSNRTKPNAVQWFSWYTLAKPAIHNTYAGREISMGRSNPSPDEPLPKQWHSFIPNGFNNVLWTYDRTYNPAKFTCNGIVIPLDPGIVTMRTGIMTNVPRINVIDNEARLPLNLSRNNFTQKLSFNNDLIADIYKDFLAYVLMMPIQSVVTDKNISLVKQAIRYPGLISKFTFESFAYGEQIYNHFLSYALLKQPLLGKNGFTLDYNYCLRKSRKVNALFIQTDEKNLPNLNLDIKDYFIKFSANKVSKIADFKFLIEPMQAYQGSYPAVLLMKKTNYDYLFDPDIRRVGTAIKKNARKFHEIDEWVGLDLGLKKTSILNQTLLKENAETINLIREYEINCKTEGNKQFNELLERYLGDDVIIPYELEERKAKYPLAFSELESYMQQYLQINS